MVCYDPVYQSYDDIKVSAIKNLWYWDNAFILVDACEIKGLEGTFKKTSN